MKTKSLHTLCFLILHSSFILSTHAQGTAFTYQGRLNSSGAVANGNYDLLFTLFNTNSSGVGGPVAIVAGLAVSNGLFTTTLNFGADVFDGSARWLEIAVRT